MSELGRQVGSLGTLTNVVKLLVAVSVLTSYPILMNVLVREMETATGVQPDAYDSRARYLMSRTLLRSFFIVLSTAVAVFMPYFQDFMELVGALCAVFSPLLRFGRRRRMRRRKERRGVWGGGGGACLFLLQTAL